MKVWELEKLKVYTCDGIKYTLDKDKDLMEKRILKRNGCESWFYCNKIFNEIRNMEFEEIGEDIGYLFTT